MMYFVCYILCFLCHILFCFVCAVRCLSVQMLSFALPFTSCVCSASHDFALLPPYSLFSPSLSSFIPPSLIVFSSYTSSSPSPSHTLFLIFSPSLSPLLPLFFALTIAPSTLPNIAPPCSSKALLDLRATRATPRSWRTTSLVDCTWTYLRSIPSHPLCCTVLCFYWIPDEWDAL